MVESKTLLKCVFNLPVAITYGIIITCPLIIRGYLRQLSNNVTSQPVTLSLNTDKQTEKNISFPSFGLQ